MNRSNVGSSGRFFPSSLKNYLVMTGLAIGLQVLCPTGKIMAADVLPAGAVSTKSAGRMSSDDSLHGGDTSVGLAIDGASDTAVGVTGDRVVRAQKTHQAAVTISIGLMDRLELGLGLKATEESMDNNDRRALFGDGLDSSDSEESSVVVKNRAMSGATGSLKVAMVKGSIFRMSMIGFGEGGAGSDGSNVVSRSAKPKAGWLLVSSLGQRGVAELSLSGGMRYRDPEEIGGLRLRHEALGGAGLKAYVTKKFAFFGSYQARRLMVGESLDGSFAGYHGENSSLATGGLTALIGDATWSLYGGRGIGSDALGTSRSLFGVSVDYQIGRLWGERKGAMILADEEKGAKKPAAAAESTEKPAAPTQTGATEAFLDPQGNPIDVYKTDEALKAADGQDDFDMFHAEALKRKSAGPNEDEKAEDELTRLRAADAKVQAEKERAKTEAEALRKADDQKYHEENAAKAKRYEQEVKSEVNKIQGVGQEDVSWNGLED